HFWFRQYSATQGRWMVPDPAGIAAASPMDPQTWNRYAYSLNDPMGSSDPLGLSCDHPEIKDSEPCVVNVTDVNTKQPTDNDSYQPIKVLVDYVWGPTRKYPHLPQQRHSALQAWQFIKKAARTIGNYIPIVCGGGVYNYGGVQLSDGVSSTALSKMMVA